MQTNRRFAVVLIGLTFGGVFPATRADVLEYRYDCDVLPYDPSEGWLVFNPCESAAGCFESTANGHLVLQWPNFGDVVNFHRFLPGITGDFWVEWQFRSNTAYIPTDPGCDGTFITGSYDPIWMSGNRVENAEGGSGLGGLPLDQFQSYRFERRAGNTFMFSVNGHVFISRSDNPSRVINYIQVQGRGACNRPPFTLQRNMWDHVWYGTPSGGQVVVASDPSAGIVNAAVHPSLDTFTITLNEAGFVHVNEVAVTVSPPEAVAPEIQWTRRQVNGEPDTIEIVLTSSLPLNATTTFSFDFGGESQVVEYTYLLVGSCCLPSGQCLDNSDADCGARNGQFSPAGQCERDADEDGVDGVCGDQCPMDENKIAPGTCGCGMSDIDSDGDTVADCLDQCPGQDDLLDSDGDTFPDCLDRCPGEDDRIDADENGTPDCAQFQPIPTASAWGLGILTLLILVAAKLRSIRYSLFDIQHSSSPLTKGGWSGAPDQGGRRFRTSSVALLLLASSNATAATRYAKTAGTGSADCSSWANACTLATALSGATSGDQIWVKSGTYAPFALKNAVKIIGGFAGTESAASQSNPTANATIVDGSDQYQCITGDGEAVHQPSPAGAAVSTSVGAWNVWPTGLRPSRGRERVALFLRRF